jgi:phospholipid/cholesterol/gamma-HCH transport system ATP-binding protein
MFEPVIVIEDLHKHLQNKHVLRGINLEVRRGETRVIVGQSGEGKSVLLKHILGLMVPDRGRIIIDGNELDLGKSMSIQRVQQKISMVFQQSALFDSLNVRDNVGFTLINKRVLNEGKIDRVVMEKLAMVNLHGIENVMPSELSGGMKKRVAIARALATEPEIILFDEPTTGLDPITAESINDLIVDLKNKLRVTQLVVTHDIHSSCKIADSLSMLHDGKIVATGSVSQMMQSTDPYIRKFMTISMKRQPAMVNDETINVSGEDQ